MWWCVSLRVYVVVCKCVSFGCGSVCVSCLYINELMNVTRCVNGWDECFVRIIVSLFVCQSVLCQCVCMSIRFVSMWLFCVSGFVYVSTSVSLFATPRAI